ncbi:hypothetical protein R3X27_19425 [Tropicimonas sp. TH_r6]|uniref:hypothetical protein n=1 Tax=Tropicimonas sp. TH_r6 TaxID=3082085 RepID=UPI002953E996|nr:hypothetical protein [Tropicimonas sp. TH_r6]MDV7144857.1 hypothetical protein [Tropicimonas sp. TH_r6]
MIQFSKPARNAAKCITWAVALVFLGLSAPVSAQGTGIHRAVITIPNPRSANLLQLRGLGGSGTAHIQIGSTCHDLPVRFVAGGFSGDSIEVRRAAPIVLEIRDAQIVEALLNGADIVSDEADGIVIHSGLSADAGYVINPGRNISADVFGARASETPCNDGDANPTPKSIE